MALPSLELTWQWNLNQAFDVEANAVLTYQKMMFAIKESLVGFASSPWTVVGSSDTSPGNFGMDNVDRWTSYDKVVYNGGSGGAWIVLKQTNLSSNFQLLLFFGSPGWGDTQASRIEMFVSPNAGFTGGSENGRPTATDETGGTMVWFNNTQSPFQSVVHVQQSDDGTATRVFLMYSGYCVGYWNFQKVVDATAGWTIPVIWNFTSAGNNSNIITYGNFNQSPNLTGARFASTNTAVYLTGEGFGDGVIGENYSVANQLDNSYPILPMGIACTTEGFKGRHGRLQDIWWGQASVPPANSGTTYPADGSRQFIQFGHMVFPWNGSAPIIG